MLRPAAGLVGRSDRVVGSSEDRSSEDPSLEWHSGAAACMRQDCQLELLGRQVDLRHSSAEERHHSSVGLGHRVRLEEGNLVVHPAKVILAFALNEKKMSACHEHIRSLGCTVIGCTAAAADTAVVHIAAVRIVAAAHTEVMNMQAAVTAGQDRTVAGVGQADCRTCSAAFVRDVGKVIVDREVEEKL